MENNNYNFVGQFIKILFFIVLFAAIFFLKYSQAIGVYPSAVRGHIYLVTLIYKQHKIFAECGLQQTVYFLSTLFHANYATIMVWILTFFYMFYAFILYRLINFILDISPIESYLITLALLLVSSIYIPFFNPHIYLGQWTPNPWIDPTITMIKPFALIVTIFIVGFIKAPTKPKLVVLAISLLAATYYKPSFTVVFLPALLVYLLIYYRRDRERYIQAGLLILPGCIYLIYQFYLLHFHTDASNGGRIIIDLFGVLHLYTPNIFISLILGIAFPLVFSCCYWEKIREDHRLQICWFMLLFGYIQQCVFAQSGGVFAAANFCWGYMIALAMLFVFTFISFYEVIRTSENSNSLWNHFRVNLCCIVFSLHLVSGVFYFLRVMAGYSYF